MLQYLFWSVLIFFKTFIPAAPFYHGQRIQLYFCLILIVVSFFKSKGDIPKSIFNTRLLTFIGVVLALQIAAMLYSSRAIDVPRYNYNIVSQYVSLLVFIVMLYIHFVTIEFSFRTVSSVKLFLKGGILALSLVLLVSYIQLFYTFIPSLFTGAVQFIGDTVEARWIPELPGEEVHRFYWNGSYVETNQRVNGLTEEASTNAMFLAIVFIPFLIASIKNGYNVFTQKKQMGVIYTLLTLVLIILITGKTSLGIIFCLATFLILLKDISFLKKCFVIGAAIVSLLIMDRVAGLNIIELLLQTSDKVNNFNIESTANRLGSTVALLATIGKHFFIGVGRGYLSFYIMDNMPQWATLNNEYAIYSAMDNFPVLSSILGFIGEYGLFIFVIIVWYMVRVLNKYTSISKEQLQSENNELFKTLTDTFRYFLLFFLIGLFFNIDWFHSAYIIIFFFLMGSLRVLKKSGGK